jgi:hypothetical protein
MGAATIAAEPPDSTPAWSCSTSTTVAVRRPGSRLRLQWCPTSWCPPVKTSESSMPASRRLSDGWRSGSSRRRFSISSGSRRRRVSTAARCSAERPWPEPSPCVGASAWGSQQDPRPPHRTTAQAFPSPCRYAERGCAGALGPRMNPRPVPRRNRSFPFAGFPADSALVSSRTPGKATSLPSFRIHKLPGRKDYA